VVVLAPVSAVVLGRVFGRDHVVHVAIAVGRLGERLAVEAGRLSGLRSKDRGEPGRKQVDGANR
jgi:hypothetical protein